MPDFPAAVPDLADATVSETLFTMHGNAGHVPATNRILLNLRGLAGKLGIGASTPSSPGVLRQSGGAGSTAWGLVQPGDISPGAGNANRSLLVNPSGSAVAYAPVPSGGLVAPGPASANTVARTTDGTNVVYGKVGQNDMAAGGTATPADRILVSSNTTPSWGQLTDAMVAAGAGIAAAKLFAGGTGNRVLRTTDGTNPIWGQVGTPDIAALSLSQAAGIAIGPSANQSWSSTVAFQPVNQCTVTLTGCLASSYYLVFGAFGATHSVANGRNQARIWCATSGAMLGWFSPSMGNATAGLQFAHSIVAFGAVSVSGSITFELHAAQVEAGTTLVAANTGFLMAVELRRGGL
jgi:hypothetical protein